MNLVARAPQHLRARFPGTECFCLHGVLSAGVFVDNGRANELSARQMCPTGLGCRLHSPGSRLNAQCWRFCDSSDLLFNEVSLQMADFLNSFKSMNWGPRINLTPLIPPRYVLLQCHSPRRLESCLCSQSNVNWCRTAV